MVMSMEGSSLTNPMRGALERVRCGNAEEDGQGGTVRHVSPKEAHVGSSRITQDVSSTGCHLRSFTLCRTQGE